MQQPYIRHTATYKLSYRLPVVYIDHMHRDYIGSDLSRLVNRILYFVQPAILGLFLYGVNVLLGSRSRRDYYDLEDNVLSGHTVIKKGVAKFHYNMDNQQLYIHYRGQDFRYYCYVYYKNTLYAFKSSSSLSYANIYTYFNNNFI